MRDFVDEELELARSLPLTPHYRVEPECADPVLRALIHAKALLTPETWVQDAGCGRDNFCAVVAVSHAAADLACDDAVTFEARNILREQVPGGKSTVDFNDARGTSLNDIHALFDRAIASRTAEVGK